MQRRLVSVLARAGRMPARQLHSTGASMEQLFNADRVRQYEQLHRVPDKESALAELEELGKPGGRSVVEFYFGESNAAAVISSVNTIKKPPVSEDELLLFASRMPVGATAHVFSRFTSVLLRRSN